MSLKEKIVRFLAEQPKPGMVFQFSPGYVAALRTDPETRSSDSGGEHFWRHPLPPGVLEANYLKPNIKDRGYLQKVLDEVFNEVRPQGNSVNLLLPEVSGRVFIFSLENTLANPLELNRFVEWRLSRQLTQDISQIRYSYQVFNSGPEKKVLVLCSADDVVKEYESLFHSRKINTGKVTLPSLSVLNLVLGEAGREDDLLVADLDHDYLSLIALAREGFLLYRQKPVWSEVEPEKAIEEATNEIENTVNFIEDKLKRRLQVVYLRSKFGRDSNLDEKLKVLAPIKIIKIRPGHEELVPLLGGL